MGTRSSKIHVVHNPVDAVDSIENDSINKDKTIDNERSQTIRPILIIRTINKHVLESIHVIYEILMSSISRSTIMSDNKLDDTCDMNTSEFAPYCYQSRQIYTFFNKSTNHGNNKLSFSITKIYDYVVTLASKLNITNNDDDSFTTIFTFVIMVQLLMDVLLKKGKIGPQVFRLAKHNLLEIHLGMIDTNVDVRKVLNSIDSVLVFSPPFLIELLNNDFYFDFSRMEFKLILSE